MTATELHEALQGVPEEALCADIILRPGTFVWRFIDSGNGMEPHHAAALQRDAMTEFLLSRPVWSDKAGYGYGIEVQRINNGWAVCVEYTKSERVSVHPTRLHALAAAVRYVKEQEGKR